MKCSGSALSNHPMKQRPAILASSGVQAVLLRDYLDKQHSHDDLSVVPKFWPPTACDLAEIRIVIQNTTGFAGIALTRRGLAVRAWNDNIASIRRAVLPTDPRLTKENMHVVPRFPFNSSGWPPAIQPCFVVSSTLQATSHAPIPTRAFRTGGVYSWSLAFDKKPSVLRFTLDINGSTFEIPIASKGIQVDGLVIPALLLQGLSLRPLPSLMRTTASLSLRSVSTSLSKGRFVLKVKLMHDSRRSPPLSGSFCKPLRAALGIRQGIPRPPNTLDRRARSDGGCQRCSSGLPFALWLIRVRAS